MWHFILNYHFKSLNTPSVTLEIYSAERPQIWNFSEIRNLVVKTSYSYSPTIQNEENRCIYNIVGLSKNSKIEAAAKT